MSRWIDADALKANCDIMVGNTTIGRRDYVMFHEIDSAPSIDIVRCKECIYYDSPHVESNGRRIEYADLPNEAFDTLGTGYVCVTYGINIGGRCTVDYNAGYADDKRVFRNDDDFCSRGERRE